MKQTVFILMLALLAGCISSQKHLKRGNYNKAFEKSVRKLQRRKDKPEEIQVLQKAYQRANEEARDRITYLNKEGDPGRWAKILRIYKSMQNRQETVEALLPLKVEGERVDFKHVNYTDKIIEARENAAEYHYNQGEKLLRKRDKQAYREAYQHFSKARQYVKHYKDAKEKMEAAKEMGTVLSLVTVKNNTDENFSKSFYNELLSFGTSGLNSDWLEFIVKEARDNFDYDYVIYAEIDKVEVSPERTHEEAYTKTKKIQDGWEYELDADGNVKKDSLGNDIKHPKFEKIKCRVKEHTQSKVVALKGNIEIIDNQKNQVIVNRPVEGVSHFKHTFIVANGDLRALPKKLRKQTGSSPVAYPEDDKMIMDAAEEFRKAFKRKIYATRKYLE